MKIRQVVHHNHVRWRVHISAGGKSHRYFFKTEEEARIFAKSKEKENTAYGKMWLSLSASERVEVMAAFERAWQGGYKLSQACDLYELHRAAPQEAATVADAVARCLADKKTANVKRSSLAKLRLCLERLSRAIGPSKPLTGAFLRDYAHAAISADLAPATRKGIRIDLLNFGNWCVRNGLLAENPVEKIPVPILDDKEPGILTVDQSRRLMESCVKIDVGMAAFFGLCLFAGIRPAEVLKLKEEHLHLDESWVEVPGPSAKTRKRRIVHLTENCLAWVRLGSIPVRNWRKRFDLVRSAAGLLEGWPHDAMRHSFCSYHLAMWHDPARTALEAGHTEQVLFAKYRKLVRPGEAEEFWGIVPTS